jgi:hypothetical protein
MCTLASMFAIIVLLLLAIAPLIAPDVRSQPWAWVLSGICRLGLIGPAYGKWHEFAARQAMIDLNERDKRR